MSFTSFDSIHSTISFTHFFSFETFCHDIHLFSLHTFWHNIHFFSQHNSFTSFDLKIFYYGSHFRSRHYTMLFTLFDSDILPIVIYFFQLQTFYNIIHPHLSTLDILPSSFSSDILP